MSSSELARIETMFLGLEDMYASEGMAVRRIAPMKHQSMASFRRYVDSLIKHPVDGRKGIVAITKHKGVVKEWSSSGVKCGVVVFLPGVGAMGLGYTDIDMSIASMRTHLHKYVLERGEGTDIGPDVCVVCMEAPKSIQCSHCFTSTCRECYVKTMLIKENIDDGMYECPGCRRETHILDVVENVLDVSEYCCRAANRAILLAMKGIDRTETCLTIVATEPEVQVHTLAVTCDSDFTNLQKKHTKAVKKLLATRGTRFLVGEPPVKCQCCDTLNHGDLVNGRAFSVEQKGIWTLQNQFGLMMVLVAWL